MDPNKGDLDLTREDLEGIVSLYITAVFVDEPEDNAKYQREMVMLRKVVAKLGITFHDIELRILDMLAKRCEACPVTKLKKISEKIWGEK